MCWVLGVFLGWEGKGRLFSFISVGTTPSLFKNKLLQFRAFVKVKFLVLLILMVVGHSAIKKGGRLLLSSNNDPCTCYFNLGSLH